MEVSNFHAISTKTGLQLIWQTTKAEWGKGTDRNTGRGELGKVTQEERWD